MSKKRKPVEKIKYTKLDKSQEACPECLGDKQPYCRRDLCGEWFDKCQAKEKEDD